MRLRDPSLASAADSSSPACLASAHSRAPSGVASTRPMLSRDRRPLVGASVYLCVAVMAIPADALLADQLEVHWTSGYSPTKTWVVTCRHHCCCCGCCMPQRPDGIVSPSAPQGRGKSLSHPHPAKTRREHQGGVHCCLTHAMRLSSEQHASFDSDHTSRPRPTPAFASSTPAFAVRPCRRRH